MKKCIVFILLLIGLKGFTQGFPGTDSMRTYNSKYITNNPATSFTNVRLHTLLRGIIDWIDTARAGTGGGGAVGVDSIAMLNDTTMRYRKNGSFKTLIIPRNLKSRRSIVRSVLDSLQLDNDSAFSAAPSLPFVYKIDTFNRRGYYEDKYVVAKKYIELKGLRNCDTAHIYRLVNNGMTLDYVLKQGDASTVDDTVVTVVTNAGQRLRLVVPDNVYDVRWFGAKCDGTTDDTEPVKNCLRALKKYSNDRGGTVRLIDNKFDPTDLIYPPGSTTILLNGDMYLIHPWKLSGNVNLIGESGSNNVVQFGRGPRASLTALDTDSAKAVLHLVGTGGVFKNFNIMYPTGKGIWIDGWSTESGQFACAQKEFRDVGVIAGDTSTTQPVLIEHAIWIYFFNCSFPALTKSQYAITMQNRLSSVPGYKLDMAATGLIFFDGLNLSTKGILISATADNGQEISNIHIRDCIYELPDSAFITTDSRVCAIGNLFFENISLADGEHYLINNRGTRTSKITVDGLFTRGTTAISAGNAITDLVVDGQPEFQIDAVLQDAPVFRQYRRIKSEADFIDANAGWSNLVFKNPYANLENVLKTDTVTGFRDPAGNFTAKRFDSETQIYTNASADVDSGDYVFAGAWVRSQNDSVIKNFSLAAVKVNSTNMTYLENGSAFMDLYERTSAFENQGWTLFFGIQRVNGVTGTVNMTMNIAPETGNPLLVWRPWLMIIKDSVTKPTEVYAWAKKAIGNIESNVPKGARGIGGYNDFYVGDSTYFDAEEKKWFQDTQIPYPADDSSKRVATTEWVKQQGFGAGGSIYTFTDGLTETSGTVRNNLITGVSGGQTILGSTSTTSGLNIRTTSAAGTTGANMLFQTGNNGDIEAMRIRHDGLVSIGGTSSMSFPLTVNGIINTIGSSAGLVINERTGNTTSFQFYSPSQHVFHFFNQNAGANQFTLDNGKVIIPSLASGGTAPTTTGATKMAITDANGLLSFTNTPVSSINSQTGSTQTIAGGTGISVNSGSNTHTISIDGNYFQDGRWLPTATNGTNVTGVAVDSATFIRQGNRVSYTANFVVTCTSAIQSDFDFTLPIASNLGASYDLGGVAGGGDGSAGYATSNTTNDRAQVIFKSNTAGSVIISVTGHYTIFPVGG